VNCELPTARDLTGAEVVAVSAQSLAAVAVVAAYLVYRAGLTIAPFPVLLFSLTVGGGAVLLLRRRATWNAGELIAFLSIFTVVLVWLLWLARPNLLPIGGGSDLTHHMVLIEYIAHHWQLVEDQALVPYLGDMIYYTPGSHLLIALASAWTRADVLHVVHPVLALSVALKSGLVFLVALRLLPRDVPRVPLAMTAVVLLFLPLDYFIGAFTHDSFWAQVIAEVFACGMWWALVLWDERPSRIAMALFAMAGAATFIVWPIWVGPLIVALVALVVLREGLPWKERLTHLTVALAPIAILAAIHMAGRLRWLVMAATSGAVIRPSASVFGGTFLVLSVVGLCLIATRREGRATTLLAGAIGAQAVALFVLATSRGADTPYMAYKMIYLMIYPLAAAASLAIAEVWRILARSVGGPVTRTSGLAARGESPPAFGRRIAALGATADFHHGLLAWALLIVLGVLIARQVTPAPVPIVSESVYLAGLWARTHTQPACVDYLVAKTNTAYWLHLAVLGNPRTTARLVDPDTFDPRKAVIRWLYPDGLPFAIVDDLSALPNDVRDRLDVVARFDRSAVVKRRGPSLCP
jgi:hypothetical protein